MKAYTKIDSITVIAIDVNCYLYPCIISIITILLVIALFPFITQEAAETGED